MMCSVLFAAGAFCGIMSGTGMITEMANALGVHHPRLLGEFFPAIVGVTACLPPAVRPRLPSTTACCPCWPDRRGLRRGRCQRGPAAILGQMTVGFPIPLTPSTFLLVGLVRRGPGRAPEEDHPAGFCRVHHHGRWSPSSSAASRTDLLFHLTDNLERKLCHENHPHRQRRRLCGDRLEPSLELIEKGNLTTSATSAWLSAPSPSASRLLKDPPKGYNGLLEHRMEKALPCAGSTR